MQDNQTKLFLETLWDHYAKHARHDLPWRQPGLDGNFDSYRIMVSELMLQQTQVGRVIPKYHEFLERFPTFGRLAKSPLGDVLRVWQGLGYNRRAKFLWQSAQILNTLKFFPDTVTELKKLPGIGHNTAAAILAYSFNHPVIFIETNIRTVYIHHFFPDEIEVDDKVLLPIVEQTMDCEHPREFYWALMDYGNYLKRTVGNASRSSRHFTKQSKFEGSRRQVRGQVVRLLSGRPYAGPELVEAIIDERLPAVLNELTDEKLIRFDGTVYSLA